MLTTRGTDMVTEPTFLITVTTAVLYILTVTVFDEL